MRGIQGSGDQHARHEMSVDDPDGFCAVEAPHVDCEVPAREDTPLSDDSTPDEDERVSVMFCFYHDDPESMRRYRIMNQAEDVRLALWDFINGIENGIHNIVKWERDPAFWEGMSGYDTLAWVEERLAEVFEAHGVDWDG